MHLQDLRLLIVVYVILVNLFVHVLLALNAIQVLPLGAEDKNKTPYHQRCHCDNFTDAKLLIYEVKYKASQSGNVGKDGPNKERRSELGQAHECH